MEEYQARERVYLAGLTGQAFDMARMKAMASDVLDTYGDRPRAAVRSALSHPTVNMEVMILRQKLRDRDQQITHLKEELEANRFDQQAPAGQSLMIKCKALLTENRELGEEMREERMAELRSALEAEQRQNADLYQKVNEAAEFMKELSDENVKLQGTIARVACKLREARTEQDQLIQERGEAKKKRKVEKIQKAAMKTATEVALSAGEQPLIPEVIAQASEAPPAASLSIDEAMASSRVAVVEPEEVSSAIPSAEVVKHKSKDKKKDKDKKDKDKSKKRKAVREVDIDE